MAEDLDAMLDELPNDVESSTDVVENAQPDSAAEAAAIKRAELDAVVPDDPNIDEDFRGKPLADVLRTAAQQKHQIGVAQRKSQEFNALESRARMAEATVEFMRNQSASAAQAQPRYVEPDPIETDEALLDRLSARPTQVLPEIVDRHVAPLEAKLRQTEERLLWMSANSAREQARVALGIDPDTWDAITPQVASITAARQLNIEDPRAWHAAGKEFIDNAQRLIPRQPAPVVNVPRPAAPQSGGARSTSRPSAAPRLNPRDRENAIPFLDAFNIKPDSAAFKDFETFAATRKGSDE